MGGGRFNIIIHYDLVVLRSGAFFKKNGVFKVRYLLYSGTVAAVFLGALGRVREVYM